MDGGYYRIRGMLLITIYVLHLQANEYDIADLRPFFSSTDFAKAHFELDQVLGVIKCPRRLVTW